MTWPVVLHRDFEPELLELSLAVQEELATMTNLLETNGPMLGRPHVDTLSGSRHANMKELRFRADGGVWRVAFAFDPLRNAVLLLAGNKAGVGQSRFYEMLIAKADKRFSNHLEAVRDM